MIKWLKVATFTVVVLALSPIVGLLFVCSLLFSILCIPIYLLGISLGLVPNMDELFSL